MEPMYYIGLDHLFSLKHFNLARAYDVSRLFHSRAFLDSPYYCRYIAPTLHYGYRSL